ncbi:MAG: hypothetical protein RLN82_02105 [Pseudomonadales bacterium]
MSGGYGQTPATANAFQLKQAIGNGGIIEGRLADQLSPERGR